MTAVATNESLFQLMRFNILNSARSNPQHSGFSSAYVYAWDSGVYPLHNEMVDWHKPFVEQFDVTEDEVSELNKFLCDKWETRTPISFYELESHYGVSGSSHSSSNWNRSKLVRTCRYLYLMPLFDTPFWATLLENGRCPMEAGSISRPFKESDIYFM
jgi:hypothetical protein